MNKTCLAIVLAALSTAGQHAIGASDVAQSSSGAQDAKAGDDVDLLRQELAAQNAINGQLRQRLDQLERQLSTDTGRSGGLVQAALDPNAPKPPADPQSDSANTAIEQALVSRGLVLLPQGAFRLTPAASWSHSGANTSSQDAYAISLTAEAGLPWGLAASVNVPYLQVEHASYGTNRGLGDVSFSLAKHLTNDLDGMPSLVARADYTHDTGKDAFGFVPIGSGFRSYSAGLSAVKRLEPVAVYGSLTYIHTVAQSLSIQGGSQSGFRGRIAPGSGYATEMGVSLAATPAVSLDAGLSFSFWDRTRFEPMGNAAYEGSRATVGYLNLGAGFLLRKDLFLSVSAAAGVTKDASPFVLSVALPYRF